MPLPSEPAPRRGGRPKSKSYAHYCERFGVPKKTVARVGLDQLERCRDDDARAVLLRMIAPRRPAGV